MDRTQERVSHFRIPAQGCPSTSTRDVLVKRCVALFLAYLRAKRATVVFLHPRAIQNDVLGKGRAQLREGEPNRFILAYHLVQRLGAHQFWVERDRFFCSSISVRRIFSVCVIGPASSLRPAANLFKILKMPFLHLSW